ncbi:MAG: hypothetical protein PHX34_02900 [Candidatus Shapirobacteria bacterium]|nr:hypothetical protein [Candidatus Shapirobacteria bacterium]
MIRPKESDFRNISQSNIENIYSTINNKNRPFHPNFKKNQTLVQEIINKIPPETKLKIEKPSDKQPSTSVTFLHWSSDKKLVVQFEKESRTRNISPIHFCEITDLARLNEDRTEIIPNQKKIKECLYPTTPKLDQSNP